MENKELTKDEQILIEKYRESRPYSKLVIQKQSGKITRITIEDSFVIENKNRV